MKSGIVVVWILSTIVSVCANAEVHERVIADVSEALETSTNPEVRREAGEARALALTGLRQQRESNCPQAANQSESTERLTPNTSPIDGTERRPESVELFFEFQFLLSGRNGEPSFQSMPVPRVNARDAIGNYARRNGMTRSEVMGLSDEELRSILTDAAGSGLTGQALTDTVNNSLIITRMTQFGTAEEALAFAGQQLQSASFGQKVNFLANYLDYLEDNYEFDMINGGPTVGEDRWDQDLHEAMASSFANGGTIDAGICRHMHQMAVRLARQMGIDEAFGVGFRTAGGGHRTMVLTHPDDPTQVVQLNYGKVSSTNGVSGPAALSQNHTLPSSGIRFRIYNGNDDAAIILPSELGGVLNRVTGGEDSDLGPRYQSDAQVQQFGVNTPYGTVRFFRAATPMGNQEEIVGGAYNARVDYNDVFYGEYGIAGFHSERPTEQGGMRQSGGYVRMTQGYNWEFYSSDNASLRTFGELHGRVAVYCASEGEADCEVNADYNVDAQVGIAADYRTGPLWHRTSLIGQLQFDQAHATNGVAPTAILPTVSLTHDMYFELDDNVVGNVGGGVTMYNLGTGQYFTYDGHAGIESRRSGTSFMIQSTGRINNDTPFWLPDAERQGSAQLRQQIFDERLWIGAEGRQSFDVLDNHHVGFTIGGRFGR